MSQGISGSEKNNQQTFSIELSRDRLREIIDYNPETGVFIWINPISSRLKAGDIAGSNSDNYIRICVYGRTYYAHVLAWFWTYGEWTLVDHKNRNTYDNRLSNLRAATKQQNAWNQNVRGTNLLGVKGVQQRGVKFRAYITVNYCTIHLGTFNMIEEAIEARRQAELKYFGEFAHG